MVWFPGGGNTSGGTSEARYEGAILARKGVIVVTVNYRLGAFGFFAHPALSRESPHGTSGNQGLLDQIAALRWVAENAEAFGGDPRSVTVFGESAGSVDIGALLTSSLSKGLFHRAIGGSGPVTIGDIGEPQTRSEAEAAGRALAAKWNVSVADDITRLRTIPAAAIIRVQPIPPRPFLGISMDGYVLTQSPIGAFQQGRQHAIPLMLGSEVRDWAPAFDAPANVSQSMDDKYGPFADRARMLYTADDPLYGPIAQQWATDTGIRCPVVNQLIWHAMAGHTAFQYEISHLPPRPIRANGNLHGLEPFYSFGLLEEGIRGTRIPSPGFDASDRRLVELIQSYWTNFARSGDPNGPNLPPWPPFQSATRAYMSLSRNGSAAAEGLRRPFCDLFLENGQRSNPR